MKRDMDLIRKILFAIEASGYDSPARWIHLDIEGHTQEEVSYHVLLLDEAGLIVAADTSRRGSDWKPIRLTWEGHEFLEATKDERIWNKAKALLAEKGGGLVFEVLKELLLGMVKGQVLGQPLP